MFVVHILSKQQSTQLAIEERYNQMTMDGMFQSATYDASFFDQWACTLKTKVVETLVVPSTLPASFPKACAAVEHAHGLQNEAEKKLEELSKKAQGDNMETILAQAKETVTMANDQLNDAWEAFRNEAANLLDQSNARSLLIMGDDSDEHKDIMTAFVLNQLTGKQWADWFASSSSHLQQELLAALRHENDFLQRSLQSGGARHGAFPRALEIYTDLSPLVESQDAVYRQVLDRLALAVALELCDPILHFDSKTEKIDPVPRYKHYQDAFLAGQLDPAFEFFTTWELRHVVNADARNEELAWGRESLKNFRPGLVYLRDPKWRYCRIVKTDIPHKTPDWYKQPRSYDQILSGGGKCGPRAWYGRFICKAFGIPTWGAKQPGHAAMSRWTPNGWVTVLGAAFRWNSWEGRCGLDFQLETQVRRILNDNDKYLRQVSRLEHISALCGEDCKSVTGKFLPSDKCPWYSLALAQRQRLRERSPSNEKKPDPVPILSRNNEIQAILQTPLDRGSITRLQDGTIHISASATSRPKRETRTIFFPQSFLEGGQQLLLPSSESVEYNIPASVLGDEPCKYKMSCRVSTVHRHETPLNIRLQVEGNDICEPVQVPLVYTVGMWKETEPIIVEIPSAEEVTLVVARSRKEFAIGVKDFKLVPL